METTEYWFSYFHFMKFETMETLIETPPRKVNIVDMPAGHAGEGYFATQFGKVIGLARKNSLWPLPFATSCRGIEFMSTMASHYDIARFGSERVSFSPRQA